MGHWKDLFWSISTGIFWQYFVFGKSDKKNLFLSFLTLFLYFCITMNSFLPVVFDHYTSFVLQSGDFVLSHAWWQTNLQPPCILDSPANVSHMQNRQGVQFLGNAGFLPLTWRQNSNIQEMYHLFSNRASEWVQSHFVRRKFSGISTIISLKSNLGGRT